MRLGELTSVRSWLPTHPTASDPIWQRQALSVSENDIQLFYARAGCRGLRKQAIDAIDALQAAVIAAAFTRELVEPPGAIVMHETPDEPFFVDELIDGLVKMNTARRLACLFGLETNHTPESVALLTWKKAMDMHQLSQLANEILESADRMRHLRLPYVFWEWATAKIASPVLELQWSIKQAFDCDWLVLQRRYRRMVMVNRSSEATSLLCLIESQIGQPPTQAT